MHIIILAVVSLCVIAAVLLITELGGGDTTLSSLEAVLSCHRPTISNRVCQVFGEVMSETHLERYYNSPEVLTLLVTLYP